MSNTDMLSLLYAVSIYVVCFALMFINYGSFAAVIVRWAKKPIVKEKSLKITQPKLSTGELVKCYVPVYQACIVSSTLHRGAPIIVRIIGVLAPLGIVVNLINKFLLPINSYVMFYCNIIMLVCTLLFHLLYGLITAECAHIYGFSWFLVILCFLMPYVFCFHLKQVIPHKMRELHKKEVFREHSENTVVKRKSSK